MELALPHVVVRICGPGIGPALVAALGVHPVEVSEARDAHEARRVAAGRPAILVVMTDPPDVEAAVGQARSEFHGAGILLVSAAPEPATAAGALIDAVSSDQSLDDVCWDVLEAIGRAARHPGVVEHPLGPESLECDGRGIVTSDIARLAGLLFAGRRLRSGDSILHVVDPADRPTLAAALARAAGGAAAFSTLRVLNHHGGLHAAAVGLRGRGGRVTVLVQPLISGGPIVGRHVNTRDPITGLLTRWAMSRALDARNHLRQTTGDAGFIVVLRIDDCAAIAAEIGSRQTDILLERVAAAIVKLFPSPVPTSRIMGDTFLALLPMADAVVAVHRAGDLVREVHGIEVPGFAPGFTLRASVGVAAVVAGDHDLAIRQAEAAAAEAQAAGGNRAIAAGSAAFTPAQISEFTADMDLGSWEVWLQPVTAADATRPAFYEALARFDSGLRRVVSRADFFLGGRAAGLLERFDRMMLLRVLGILAAHPDVRLSVNVSHETFAAEAFPGSFLDDIRAVPGVAERLILEVAPRCIAAPPADVRERLAALADAGIAVAIDDFGSGICRLTSLTQFPLAIVKLDELVTGYVDDDPLQREFVRTVASLCHARGITTVAEYTRSPEQLGRLRDDSVDLFQGELFGMPRPAAEVLPAAAAVTAAAAT
ncbi:MAG: EAL domain-containing protein [Planctomycetaceae bacterium]